MPGADAPEDFGPASCPHAQCTTELKDRPQNDVCKNLGSIPVATFASDHGGRKWSFGPQLANQTASSCRISARNSLERNHISRSNRLTRALPATMSLVLYTVHAQEQTGDIGTSDATGQLRLP